MIVGHAETGRQQCFDICKLAQTDLNRHSTEKHLTLNRVKYKVKYDFLIRQYNLDDGYQKYNGLPILFLASTVQTGV